jgi:integrase
VIVVDRQLGPSPSSELWGPIKHGGRREVPMPNALALVLSAHIERFGAHPAGLLFWNDRSSGPVLSSTWAKYVWTEAAEAAGTSGWTYHGLRHFYCSTFLAAGISPAAIASFAGHAGASITLRTYPHLRPDDPDVAPKGHRWAFSKPAAPRAFALALLGVS